MITSKHIQIVILHTHILRTTYSGRLRTAQNSLLHIVDAMASISTERVWKSTKVMV
jgi:hypothetical protein